VSIINNKVKWCLNKAKKEVNERGIHRGLIKIIPDLETSRLHLNKAHHNLKAMIQFKEMNFSDWSASAGFYSMYHCFLSILTKYGYESRNQECTFAFIFQLIEEKKISLEKELIEKVHEIDPNVSHEEPTVIELREIGQYGTKMSIEDDVYQNLLETAQEIIDKTKEIIEI
jgi:uncharacterized protein (UPF0332 family)